MRRGSRPSFLTAVEDVCRTGRIPASWRGAGLGQRVECSPGESRSARLGSALTVRGEALTVRGCASPASAPRAGAACQGAWWVEGLPGVGFALPKSRVRERQRKPRGECPYRNEGFARALSEALDAGIRTVPEAREALSEVIPRGDLPFPHRPAGHRCCWGRAEHKRSVKVLAAIGAKEAKARAGASDRVWASWIAEGRADPWDDRERLELRPVFREAVDGLVLEELGKVKGYAEALEHGKHCSGLWDLWIERALPKEGTYAGELAQVKRAARAGRLGAEDEVPDLVSDLRERFEVGSTAPLASEWFGWSGPERAVERADYEARRASWSGGKR